MLCLHSLVHVCDCIAVFPPPLLCMWDTACRWKVVWQLSFGRPLAWRECQDDEDAGGGEGGGGGWGVAWMCARLCERLGGRDLHWVTKQMVQIGVGVLRLGKARFFMQPPPPLLPSIEDSAATASKQPEAELQRSVLAHHQRSMAW